MSRVQLGRACVTRLVEFQFELGTTSFAQTPPDGWHNLLVPDFFNPDTEKWRIAVQSWVIEVDGLTVVVDTGVGNDRQRPHMPPLDHLKTAFLTAWDSVGIDRDAVDVVINTHLHSDHVGWNTMLDDNTWVPTFPNARYLAPAADYRYFAPDGPLTRRSPRTEQEAIAQHGDQLVFADSVLPIEEAGQLVCWSDDCQISPSLRLRPAAGHTPGSSVLWLDAGAPAVFVGDITHSPLQVRRPADPCAFDVDATAAAATRRRIFTEAAGAHATMIPAHYPGCGGASIRAVGDQFEVDEWLDIEKI
ncbi:MBL fold metallo-hydrolase [Mycobacterium genavense]|uniref:MBL fold metallo-hydrolase n=1 Tax=Mycobacterium genavense TaxID=36812 RepID=UPI0004706FA2|nr:MBL fold metallo-hydrolase [Mycobacterium genavense]